MNQGYSKEAMDQLDKEYVIVKHGNNPMNQNLRTRITNIVITTQITNRSTVDALCALFSQELEGLKDKEVGITSPIALLGYNGAVKEFNAKITALQEQLK